MALRPGDRMNFDTLREAFANGDAALVECQLAATGEQVAVRSPPTGRGTAGSSSPLAP